MCGSLCFVIRTINDGGEGRGLVVQVGVSWRFEPQQGFPAGRNSMCGDCAEGLASRARASPCGLLCAGAAAFTFRPFALLRVGC